MATGKRFCKDCGIEITRVTQKHCIRCKKCQIEYRNSRSKSFIDAEKDKKQNGASNKDTTPGTTNFEEHRKKNFEAEAKEINEEMKRLGLR